MSDLKKYEGVIPAFYACYDEQGEVSPERTRALVQYFIDKGVQGLYVNGSSGECIYQSVEDRKLILEEVMAVAKGKLTIIAHVACNNTKDSMELARHAESLGVDAIATIPPIYFRLPEYSVAKYWNDISSAAPNTDYVIYNIPQLAGVALTPSLYTEMLKNPRVIGVKNSSMPVQDIQTFVSLGGEDHIVFNGPDEQFLGGRLMGAKAGIGGTYGAMPELFLKLNQLIADKDLETARELQYAINAIIGKLTAAHGNMYGVIKEVLKINEGLNIEKKVVSAHRTPDLMFKHAEEARSRGIKVIIAGAGGAAHLPGMVAAKTTLPVIGVPVKSRALSGVDSLYSIVQMPGGVPVATMAIGEAGATNAALFALRLLSVEDQSIATALADFAEEQGKIAEESTNELI